MPTPRTFIDTTYAKQIANTEEFEKEISVPSGKTLRIMGFECSAPNHSGVFAQLVWDYGGAAEDILFECSSTGSFQNLSIEKTGDGTKTLSIVFDHNNEAVGTVGLSASVNGYYV